MNSIAWLHSMQPHRITPGTKTIATTQSSTATFQIVIDRSYRCCAPRALVLRLSWTSIFKHTTPGCSQTSTIGVPSISWRYLSLFQPMDLVGTSPTVTTRRAMFSTAMPFRTQVVSLITPFKTLPRKDESSMQLLAEQTLSVNSAM